MGKFNLLRFLSGRGDLSKEEIDVLEKFQARLKYSFRSVNKEDRKQFTEALKAEGIQPDSFCRLVMEAERDAYEFIKWEKKLYKGEPIRTLADVTGKSAFSRVLIILRRLHTEASEAKILPFDESVRIVIEEVLLLPK